mmetsp:Transcript_6079/g.19460  ORF Transcript_6079/g.19460 Transcript_6079/m.19460 type:complete len:205 (-) Transcript_6079:436-1050(-)
MEAHAAHGPAVALALLDNGARDVVDDEDGEVAANVADARRALLHAERALARAAVAAAAEEDARLAAGQLPQRRAALLAKVHRRRERAAAELAPFGRVEEVHRVARRHGQRRPEGAVAQLHVAHLRADVDGCGHGRAPRIPDAHDAIRAAGDDEAAGGPEHLVHRLARDRRGARRRHAGDDCNVAAALDRGLDGGRVPLNVEDAH